MVSPGSRIRDVLAAALLLFLSACAPRPSTPESRDRALSAPSWPPVLTARTVATEHGRVQYFVAGSGTTVLTLVHGWACDHRAWSRCAPFLTEHYRLIAIDLPGHGGSTSPTTEYSMAVFASAIGAVLDREHIAHTVLIGHSNGVPVVREFYRQQPARVAKLVLIDGALRSMVGPDQIAQFRPILAGPDAKAFVARMVRDMPSPNLTDADRDELAAMATEQRQGAILGGFDAATDPKIWKPDPIAVPILMLNARQPAWTADYEKFVHELIAKLDYRVIDQVGHFIMYEKPAEFAEWVTAFVDEAPVDPSSK